MTTVVLLVLGTLLGVVLMQLFKKNPPPQAPAPDLSSLKVTDALVGDVLSVAGAGDSLTDLDFTADRCTRCEAGVSHWLELSGPYRARRVILRAAGDEEVEVGIHADPRKVTLADLGLSEDDLAEMDQRQNPEDVFDFDGKDWLYCRSREAKAWHDGEPPAGFYYWEFHERDGKRLLTVRKSEGEPFAVVVFTEISAGDVTVYRNARA